MTEPHLALLASSNVIYGAFPTVHTNEANTDRGAVSIEQVLWYAAAAVSVAVVAAIIWGQIKSTASTGINTPSAP